MRGCHRKTSCHMVSKYRKTSEGALFVFFLTLPICLVGMFWWREFWECFGGGSGGKRWREFHKNFKNFLFPRKCQPGGPSDVSESFWYRKISCIREGITIFIENFSSHRIEEFRRADVLVFLSTCLCLAQTALPCFEIICRRKN